MNETHTWNAPDGSGSVRFSLKAYGIEIAVANGVDFEPYNAIKAISLIPEMSSDAACAVITFNGKEHGFFRSPSCLGGKGWRRSLSGREL